MMDKPSRTPFFVGMVLAASVFFVGCANEDKSGGPTDPTVWQGVFADSRVEGVDYAAGDESGQSEVLGTFTYTIGARINFKIGDIDLGTAGDRPLVPTVEAQNHLRQTALADLAGSYVGVYSDSPFRDNAIRGIWSFTLDTGGSISGPVTPAGGPSSPMSGMSDGGGNFNATSEGAGLGFNGRVK